VTFNEYQILAESTARRTDKDTYKERFCNFGLGIAGEAGEVADYLKKIVFHEHAIDLDKLEKELGDVMWYVATIASTVNLKLDDVAEANIEKLKKRYPEGFSVECSKNRKV
jgi:NTP pyrophosphatase (non-canonical NTP hydrolase)